VSGLLCLERLPLRQPISLSRAASTPKALAPGRISLQGSISHESEPEQIAMSALPSPVPVPEIHLPNSPEQRLLDFVASLILDAAHTDPRLTQAEVADWLASVVVGQERKGNQ
jgi:hypothetical protein